MSFPKKTQIPTAVNTRSNFQLTPQHVTTSNFMELNVAYAMEMVPNESIKVNHSMFSRLEPLAVPTFGRARVSHRAFFVPFRTIWGPWTDFITDTPDTASSSLAIPERVPLIYGQNLTNFFNLQKCSTAATDNSAYDFDNGRGDADSLRIFTPYGRWCYKTLLALGYKFTICDNTLTYSAMPLRALARIFIDWYYPSQYASDSNYLFVSSLLEQHLEAVSFTETSIDKVMELMYNISYEADYFTSAWDNPMSPNDSLYSEYVINDVSLESTSVGQEFASAGVSADISSGGTPYLGQFALDSMVSPVSQYILNALRSLTDYMKRHQIVGARALDRYLARFGVKLPAEKLNRSVLIESYSQDLQFGDVTSTSSTDTASLGDYAGKGLTYGNGNYVVDSNGEYGMFIVISNIIPKTEYYQGLNRHVLHLTRTDFWTPEFDALGTQAIAASEFYVPLSRPENWSNVNDLNTRIFGFNGRYSEYKDARSILSGDYVLDSRNAGKDSWTLFRDVSSYITDSSDIVHDYDIVVAKDKQQYNRIFTVVDDSADKFNIIHDFNLEVSFPGRSMFDTYEFKDAEKSDKTAVDVGGTTLN